jgi:mono/diheme cytochrome c family protein
MRRLLCVLVWCCAILSAQLLTAREWTDASGTFKLEAEFVAHSDGKVILKKPDGKFVTIPLAKLSAADQKHIQSLSTAPTAPAPTANRPPPGEELATQVHGVLRTACYRCHGEDGSSEGGFNFALNLPKLAQQLVSPKNPAASKLYQRLTATDDTAMPPAGEPRLTPQQTALFKSWIEAGTPTIGTEPAREFITNDVVQKWITADLQQADERSRRFLRYFTLTHLYNAGISADELQTYRNAFTKLVNGLSWNSTLVTPTSVDPTDTIYRLDMRGLNWNVSMWESLERMNPYALDLGTPESKSAAEMSQCQTPHVRIDWFVSVASKPPLYHQLLGIPETARELETLLRVDAATNIDQEQAIRAAFNRSGVSQNNRLIEWHKSAYGSYWKSYDFGGNTGRQNLFDYPLGPGRGPEHFQHDGGELIFTLPNGMLGFMLIDKFGNRIDQGPTDIVSDPKRPDRTVTNGVSCMSCHYAGVIPKSDEVGPAVRANPKAYEDSKAILALYRDPAELNRIYADDARQFAAAMQKLGIHSLSRSGEPVSFMASRFEQELDARQAAAELGLSTDELMKRLDDSPAMARKFAALRNPGGVIKRDAFSLTFGEATLELKLSIEARLTINSRPPVTPPPEPNPTPSPRPSTSPTPQRPPAVASLPPAMRPRTTPARPPQPTVPEFGKVDDRANEVARFENMTWGVRALALAPNGKFLLAGKIDTEIRVLHLANKAEVFVYKNRDLGSIDSLAFTPDSTHVLVGGQQGTVLVLAMDDKGQLTEKGRFDGHSQSVNCIAVSGDGKLALSGGQEKKARLWNLERGKEIAVVGGFEGPVKAVHLPQTGNLGYATDGSKLVCLDLTKEGEVTETRKLSNSWASGQAAAFSPDGKLVAVGDSYDIRQWELDTDKELRPLETGKLSWSMTYSADSSKLLAGSSNKVTIWNARTSKLVRTQGVFEGNTIKAIAAGADGKQFASGALSRAYVYQMPD